MDIRAPKSPGLAMSALAIVVFCALPSRAEFPPEGAFLDPQNPAIATGDYPSATNSGAKAHYVFYFDCGKRTWITLCLPSPGDLLYPPSLYASDSPTERVYQKGSRRRLSS